MSQTIVQEIFIKSLRQCPRGTLASLLQLDNEAETSFFMEICPIQDPLRYRAKQIGLRAANLIIDEKGELNESVLAQLIEALKTPYCIGPGRENDPPIYLHLLSALLVLSENQEIRKRLKKFSPPLCDQNGEMIIRDTLWPEVVKKPDSGQIRRAVLAAWFTKLRQTVGSCFATAPAILIQQNDPLSFFEDLYDLLTIGRLKRIVAGQQYTVPLCPLFESTDLRKSISFLESLPFSPGLAAALGGIAPQKIAQGLQEMESPVPIDRILRHFLFKQLDLTEQDLEDEEYLKKMQMSPLIARQGGVHFQKASIRSQKASDWKKLYSKAVHVFSAFTECALLRSWEYTLASFCDVKLNFTRWNLYVGLGLHPEHAGGLGSFLYQRLNKKLEECNREILLAAQEYERAGSAARALEGMVLRASDSTHRAQLQSELTGYIHAANRTLEIHRQMTQRADDLSGMLNHLLQQYDLKIQDYFQEIFDPSLLTSEEAIFDDSPAGFRLVYKHGRTDPSLWTMIQNGDQYIDCLRDFFILTEPDIASTINRDLFPTLISDLTTELVQFIQQPEFLQTAMARSNKNPAHQSAYKTPWDYSSGGTMQTLLQAYYQRDRPFTEASVLPKKEGDLVRFLSTIRSEQLLLMHSPTHAFILDTQAIPASWQEIFEKGEMFWKSQLVSEEIQERAAHLLSEKFPPIEKNLFLHFWRTMRLADSFESYRLQLIQAAGSIKGSQIKDPQGFVDSFLYETFPFYPLEIAKERASRVSSEPFSFETPYVSSSEFLEWVKLKWMKKGPFFSEDIEKKIVQTVRQMGFAYPDPILFADTNWAGWYFTWIVGPSGQLELWRMNRIGTRGFPMTGWKGWFTPEHSAPWIVLNHPIEYTVDRNRF